MSKKSKQPFKASRLQFTEEERADCQTGAVPTLEKPIAKSEKAADKVEKAQSKIPKKIVKTKERTFDADTGKTKVRLCFEEVDKPKPPSKLEHGIKKAPQRAVLSTVHQKISEDEQDNVGLEAAHSIEKAGEFTVHRVQSAYHSHKLKPYRTLAKAEKRSINADVNVLYKKSLRDNPQAASNPISRFHQKRAIKKQYITRYGKGVKTAQNTATAAKSAVKKGADAVGNSVAAMAKNPKLLIVLFALFLLIMVIAGAVSSCSVLFQGAMSSTVSTSYTSENEELIATNDDYTALETALQAQIDNIERDYPDYDEYRYDLASIGHDPHQLASYLTALLQYFKASEVQG